MFSLLLLAVSVCYSQAFLESPVGQKNQAVLDLFKKKFNGEATYYGATKEGTCTYKHGLPSDKWAQHGGKAVDALIALNKPQFMNSLTCGLCLKVTGSGHGLGNDPVKGEMLVFTKDLCPECQPGDVDLSLNGDGRWDIQIQAVQCPVGNTKIQYSFQGSNYWYVKLQVRNARIPITALQLQKGAGGAWVTLTHSADGYWLAQGAGQWPKTALPVKMTAANGEILFDRIPGLSTNDNVMDGEIGVQVSKDNSLPSA